MDHAAILALPMQDNDAGAATIGEYLGTLVARVWQEEDGFNGKRPFGNSGWKYDIYTPLVKAGLVPGDFDEDGNIDIVDRDAADALIAEVIDTVWIKAYQVQS